MSNSKAVVCTRRLSNLARADGFWLYARSLSETRRLHKLAPSPRPYRGSMSDIGIFATTNDIATEEPV